MTILSEKGNLFSFFVLKGPGSHRFGIKTGVVMSEYRFERDRAPSNVKGGIVLMSLMRHFVIFYLIFFANPFVN